MDARYLETKRSIDDRSIDQHVWEHFVSRAVERNRTGEGPLRIAEIGAGTGTMIDRLRDSGAFDRLLAGNPDGIIYDAWETNPDTASILNERISDASEIRGGTVHRTDVTQVEIAQRYDLLIAHAVLDLFPVSETLRLVDSFLDIGGFLYASILFDGVTVMEPEPDPRFSHRVFSRYHESMGGDFARAHVQSLIAHGVTIEAIASSDWIIPPRPGHPDRDETVLLLNIIAMIEESVRPCFHGADRDRFGRWIAGKRDDARDGRLFFEAHQIDLVGRR